MSGKKCVVLGRSNIVGKPMSQLMMQKEHGDTTVTVCHSHSQNIADGQMLPTMLLTPRAASTPSWDVR